MAEIISIATTNPTFIKPTHTLGEAIELMAKHGFRRLPVVMDMQLIGILTATDVLEALHGAELGILEKTVDQFMTPDPVAVYRSADLSYAIQLMFQHNLGSLPIVSEGNHTLSGIVTERDLVKAFAEIADADLAEFITPDPITLSYEDTTIGEVIDSMVNAHIRRAILVDASNTVKGIVTSTDLMRYVSEQIIRKGAIGNDELEKKANEIAIKTVITVNINKSVAEVAKLFEEKGMGGVPVVDDSGELVGIFTERDLLRIVGTYNLM